MTKHEINETMLIKLSESHELMSRMLVHVFNLPINVAIELHDELERLLPQIETILNNEGDPLTYKCELGIKND